MPHQAKDNIIYRLEVVLAILVPILAVICCLLASPIDPLPYTFPTPLPVLEGALERNTVLQKAQRWFEGRVIGPESFAVDKHGTLYTGTADGKIISIKHQEFNILARTGIAHTDCGRRYMEAECGRPKGMKFGPDGALYVVDSYKGLLRVDADSGNVETLVSNEQGSDGVPFKFLNSLEITSNGLVFFTDSSDKWTRRDFRYAVLEMRPSGRLLQYDIKTGVCSTLLYDLYIANGLSLSGDESFLLIAEMAVARIRRHYLHGEMAGTSDVFIDNLPGYPDNIKLNSKGHFFVGMGSVRFQGSSPIGSFLDLLGPYPTVKKFLATVIPLEAYSVFMPKHALAIEVDKHGRILSSLHDPGAQKIGAVSEIFEHNNTFYIGHYQSPYLGVLYKDNKETL